jgi:hypothetical protein
LKSLSSAKIDECSDRKLSICNGRKQRFESGLILHATGNICVACYVVHYKKEVTYCRWHEVISIL